LGRLLLIDSYEQRMTRNRATQLKMQTMQTLQTFARRTFYSEVYVDLGQDYRYAVEGIVQVFDNSLVTYASGRIGQRLAQLRKGLVENTEHQRGKKIRADAKQTNGGVGLVPFRCVAVQPPKPLTRVCRTPHMRDTCR
jgi:hypothetical protein